MHVLTSPAAGCLKGGGLGSSRKGSHVCFLFIRMYTDDAEFLICACVFVCEKLLLAGFVNFLFV